MTSTTPPIDLSQLAQSLYAQGTEEDILQRLLLRVQATNRYCVDIGASDGLRNSNTARLLLEQGWQGTLMEGSEYRFGRLKEHYGSAGNARLIGVQVQPETVDKLLSNAGVPAHFDLLSLDIDGNDYWVWQAMQAFRPRIVVIEYNPYYAPPERWVMRYDQDHTWDGSTYYGASLESLYHLGVSKGYQLVCCDDMGNNAFFVESELFPLLGLQPALPVTLFRPAMYKLRYVGNNTFLTGHPYRYGPAEIV